MNKNRTKVLFIISFLAISSLILPTMVFAQEEGEEDYEKTEQYGAFENYHGGFGGIFSDNMGYSGELIGSVFEMLLLDGLDLEDNEELDSVYVLSASKEETYEGEYNFSENNDILEYKYLPYYNTSIGENFYNEDGLQGFSYCKVDKEGGFGYNLTIGAALTLIIWDYDKSFITAAQKILDWAGRFREAEEKDEVNQKIVAEGVQVISWLLVHINEIFTGDELFVFNPIVWQTLDMDPWSNFNITRTWMESGPDFQIGGGDDKEINQTRLAEWKVAADITKDSYMQWLLRDYSTEDIAETLWTQFSFDVAQLWVKKFYVEIDLEEFAKGEDAKMKKAFRGCEVEFYLFTHHLAGAFLYLDNDTSNDITVEYDYLRNTTAPGNPIIYTNGTAAMYPKTNEVTHRLILASVEEFDFKKPKIDDKGEKVEWGLQLNGVNMSAVPVGVDLNSYMRAPEEELAYIYFGLDFEIDVEEPDEKGAIEAEGDLKLETNWAPWNDGKGPNNPYVRETDPKKQLDFAIVYVSSILHFELDMETRDDDPDDPDDDLLEENDFKNETHTLRIGNYLDTDEKNLDFVDIAGPGYLLGNETDRTPHAVDTSIIPLALWEGSSQMRETDPGDEDTTDDDFATDVEAEAEWNIMLYAVCYPDFNSSGLGIWHDPTFSVYMVFTPEEPSFWALILLIAGVGLAGVATILIKRRKDKW